MEEQKQFDFNEEYEKIVNRNQMSYLKLPVGIHQVVVLSEPERTFYTDIATSEVTAQIKLVAEWNKERYFWAIPYGETEASLFGQLVFIGKMNGGLTGEKLDIVVSTILNHKGETIRKYQVLNYVRAKSELQDD